MTGVQTCALPISDLQVSDRAALWQVDIGTSQGGRTGWIDGSNGNMALNGTLWVDTYIGLGVSSAVGGIDCTNGNANFNGNVWVGGANGLVV